jgi:hypothetical protein
MSVPFLSNCSVDRRVAASVAFFLLLGSTSLAQAPGPHLLSLATRAKDLPFPTTPTPLPDAARMGIHVPEGTGPFPAVILHHQCTGLNRTMLDWT